MIHSLLHRIIPDADACSNILTFLEPSHTQPPRLFSRPCSKRRSSPLRRLERSLFESYRRLKKNDKFQKHLKLNYNHTLLQGVEIFSRPKCDWISVTFLVTRRPILVFIPVSNYSLCSVACCFARTLAEQIPHCELDPASPNTLHVQSRFRIVVDVHLAPPSSLYTSTGDDVYTHGLRPGCPCPENASDAHGNEPTRYLLQSHV